MPELGLTEGREPGQGLCGRGHGGQRRGGPRRAGGDTLLAWAPFAVEGAGGHPAVRILLGPGMDRDGEDASLKAPLLSCDRSLFPSSLRGCWQPPGSGCSLTQPRCWSTGQPPRLSPPQIPGFGNSWDSPELGWRARSSNAPLQEPVTGARVRTLEVLPLLSSPPHLSCVPEFGSCLFPRSWGSHPQQGVHPQHGLVRTLFLL